MTLVMITLGVLLLAVFAIFYIFSRSLETIDNSEDLTELDHHYTPLKRNKYE